MDNKKLFLAQVVRGLSEAFLIVACIVVFFTWNTNIFMAFIGCSVSMRGICLAASTNNNFFYYWVAVGGILIALPQLLFLVVTPSDTLSNICTFISYFGFFFSCLCLLRK